MNELQLLGPRAYGEALGTAVLKATAEDFQVDEVLNIPLSGDCLLYTSPSPRDGLLSRMPSSA